MAQEGMVDALRRAHSLLDRWGTLVDIHPTPEPARLEIETETGLISIADRLDDGTRDGPRIRHLAADQAVAECLSSGLFACAAATDFTFHTVADTVEELLAYL